MRRRIYTSWAEFCEVAKTRHREITGCEPTGAHYQPTAKIIVTDECHVGGVYRPMLDDFGEPYVIPRRERATATGQLVPGMPATSEALVDLGRWLARAEIEAWNRLFDGLDLRHPRHPGNEAPETTDRRPAENRLDGDRCPGE